MTGEAFNEMMHSLSKNEGYFMLVDGSTCYPSGLLDMTVENGAYEILDEKCLIQYPHACGSDVSYIYFFLYTWLTTFVILNLVIAVILEGFDDASANEESDIIGYCIKVWKEFDPDYKMVLPVADVYKFMQEVQNLRESEGFVLHQPIEVPYIHKDKNGGKLCDLNSIPMWQATCCNMEICMERQEMHFIDAVNFTLNVLIAQNSATKHREMSNIEQEQKKLT